MFLPTKDTPLLRFALWNVATGAAVFTTTFTPTGVAGVQEVTVSITIPDADLYKRFCLTVREVTGGTVRYITFNPTSSPCPVPVDTYPLAAGSVYYFSVGAYAASYACPNLFGGSSEWYPIDFEMEAP